MYPNLWPPLELVEAALESHQAFNAAVQEAQVVTDKPSVSEGSQLHIAELLLPLKDLVSRRKAVKDQAFSGEWLPGGLIQINSDGLIFGVLLDSAAKAGQWTGWLAACETSWAGDFDVLLEPEDNPFEPMFGVIQTWNAVTVEKSPNLQATVVGQVSKARLEAIRAVAQENANGLELNIPVEPGRIALRTAAGKFSVLTGTPLAQDDDRLAYQNAYRASAARLMAQQLTHRLAKAGQAPAKSPDGFQRVKGWFAGASLPKPVYAAAMVCMVAYLGVMGVGSRNGEVDDSVQFRSTNADAVDSPNIRVKIKPNSSTQDIDALMKTAACDVVSGPDGQGFYNLKSQNSTNCRAVLGNSDLVVQLLP